MSRGISPAHSVMASHQPASPAVVHEGCFGWQVTLAELCLEATVWARIRTLVMIRNRQATLSSCQGGKTLASLPTEVFDVILSLVRQDIKFSASANYPFSIPLQCSCQLTATQTMGRCTHPSPLGSLSLAPPEVHAMSQKSGIRGERSIPCRPLGTSHNTSSHDSSRSCVLKWVQYWKDLLDILIRSSSPTVSIPSAKEGASAFFICL